MKKIKTSKLTGTALDWTVAKCEGATDEWRSDGPFLWDGVYPAIRDSGHDVNYGPSRFWDHGGPIIEREGITVGKEIKGKPDWSAYYLESLFDDQEGFHEIAATPLVAAMRCYVASKLGDEIDVPEELL